MSAHWLAIWLFCGVPLASIMGSAFVIYALVFAFMALQLVWLIYPERRTPPDTGERA